MKLTFPFYINVYHYPKGVHYGIPHWSREEAEDAARKAVQLRDFNLLYRLVVRKRTDEISRYLWGDPKAKEGHQP